MIIAGVDIGNASTETALALTEGGGLKFLSSGIVDTTGIKGTRQNIHGVFASLKQAADRAGIRLEDIGLVSLNEATPVIGDVAMETITETIITESTLIGHNPHTPGGEGLGSGVTVSIKELPNAAPGDYIPIIAADTSHEEAAAVINRAVERGIGVKGAIVQKDDAVLIVNRL
ncbi:MAG: diol dehydratase reactivase subunit alpha, partial [Treponema sp.]|nr:diol dehydratase reactivase subunit alpha [Treponema sp.]